MPRVKYVVGVCMFADISGELKNLGPVQFANGALFLSLDLLFPLFTQTKLSGETLFWTEGIWNRQVFVLVGAEKVLQTKFFETDNIIIITWFPGSRPKSSAPQYKV